MANSNLPHVLLTPGPLTTSAETKAAMARDWGSRDVEFIAMTARVCQKLERIAGVPERGGRHICVPLQGSGTFIVEAILDTLIPRPSKTLVLINGAYGRRMAEILRYQKRGCKLLEFDEDCVVEPAAVDYALTGNEDVRQIAMVHCETTSGILNPIEEIAAVVKKHGRALIIDAMSSFGALPLDVANIPCVAVAASANKCLEGVPGVGFAIVEAQALAAAQGNASSLCLDLCAQSQYLKETGQWRFTPPTHVIAALDAALTQLEAEGGVAGRGARYRTNYETLAAGMRQLGFERFMPDDVQAPIIVTFHAPNDPNYEFEEFYRRLRVAGFAIYPGKLTKVESFRIGCIGNIGTVEIDGALSAIANTLDEMGVKNRGR